MADSPFHSDFQQFSRLIRERRADVLRHVNRSLIDLYWETGKILSRRIEDGQWGKGTIRELAAFLQQEHPVLRGFSASNLWRIRQFYETYRGNEKLAPVVRELHPAAAEKFKDAYLQPQKARKPHKIPCMMPSFPPFL